MRIKRLQITWDLQAEALESENMKVMDDLNCVCFYMWILNCMFYVGHLTDK